MLLGQGRCVGRLGRDDEALEIFRQAADRGGDTLWVRAAALNNVGIILMSRGRYAEAEPYLLEGLHTNEQEGDRRGVAHSRASLGELCYRQGHLDRAAAWLDQALELAAEIEDRQAHTLAAVYRARVHCAGGRLAEAAETLKLADVQQVGDPAIALNWWIARLDLALAAGVAGEPDPIDLPQVSEDGVPTEAADQACRNACVEHLCLRLELALVSGAGEPEVLAAALEERAGMAPDAHLSAYARWLAAQASGRPTRSFSADEESILTQRARRLAEALAEG